MIIGKSSQKGDSDWGKTDTKTQARFATDINQELEVEAASIPLVGQMSVEDTRTVRASRA